MFNEVPRKLEAKEVTKMSEDTYGVFLGKNARLTTIKWNANYKCEMVPETSFSSEAHPVYFAYQIGLLYEEDIISHTERTSISNLMIFEVTENHSIHVSKTIQLDSNIVDFEFLDIADHLAVLESNSLSLSILKENSLESLF